MSQPPEPSQPIAPSQRFGTLIESASQPAQGHLPPRPPVQRTGTLIESDEEEQNQLLSGARAVGQPVQAAQHPVAPLIPSAGRAASPYRPMKRPPLALLTVYDDGKTEGEVIRIRGSRFVIGRTDGNLHIPFDGL